VVDGLKIGKKVVVFSPHISAANFVPGTVTAVTDGFVTIAVSVVTLSDGAWPVAAPWVAGDVVNISISRITGVAI
jgi:hypothetical protein